jgi:winged helix DNA-binding protein
VAASFSTERDKTPVAADLTWAQVHALRLERHHLMRRAPKKDLTKVVGEISGVQAQVMSAAELQVAVRVDCSVEDVRKALWKDKTLVKTWLMRGTLHLIPGKDLPLYTAATSRRWVRINNAWLKFMQVSEPEVWQLVDAMGAALSGTPMSREELIDVVAKDKPARIRAALKSGWGGMLKPAARNGMLCFGPSRGQNVTFVRPPEWLGSWRKVDPEDALADVARRYLRTYGPATKEDFARWWGNWSGVGVAAWAALEKELAAVSVEGYKAQMLSADLESLPDPSADPSVQLLPNFDPYLMGHSNRDHLFDPAHRWKVSRVAGWISPVVLADGRVLGTWGHVASGKTLRITVEPFKSLPVKVKSEVRARAESIAKALDLPKTEVKFA